MQDQKALLDSLMGNDRNAGKREEKRASWRDNVNCKSFLAWDCPCEFFMNESGKVAPKSPFGECSKQHSEAMKLRFQEDREYKRYRHRYLQDLQEQLRKQVQAMDKKVTADKEALIIKVEAEKDKLEASGKLGADESNTADSVDPNDGRSRIKDAQDEVCEVCGTYTAFTGAVIMRHDAGLLHVGWARLREAFAKLEKEVKVSKDGLTSDEVSANRRDELIGSTEGRERSRSVDVHKNRDQRRDNRDRRKDADERDQRRDNRDSRRDADERDQRRDNRDSRRDADEAKDRDRARRREYEQKSRGRERDARSEHDQKIRGRERETHSDMGRDGNRDRGEGDRRRDARHRDRGEDRRPSDELGRGKRGRSRREEEFDEFGRAKTIQNEYKEGQHPTRDMDTRGKQSRSRSRDVGKTTGSFIENTEDCKILQIEFSPDWQEVMNQKCAECQLSMSEWEMTCLDRKSKVLDLMNPQEVGLTVDSFPLRFKFARKD